MANFEDRRKLSELIERATKVRDSTINSIDEESFKVFVLLVFFKPIIYMIIKLKFYNIH